LRISRVAFVCSFWEKGVYLGVTSMFVIISAVQGIADTYG
jgi:hypothetical protein